MRRREFIAVLSAMMGARALGAHARQSAVPVIGFVSSGSTGRGESYRRLSTAFQDGLNQGGYVDGRNLAIEYRWAGGQYDQLPALLADLLRRQVSLIVAAGGFVSASAAKTATDTIPILFIAGFDPVRAGLVASLGRPGGNATGVSVYTVELIAKRLEQLREIVPAAKTIALLVNPNSKGSKIDIEQMDGATRLFGVQPLVLKAAIESDFEAAFAFAAQQQAGALLVSADPFFTGRCADIVALAARYALPAAYPWREYVEAGGLMSCGPDLAWAYREVGLYANRILKGAKPSDLPVQLPTRFPLLINLKTARALGLQVSRLMFARADEVIE